MPYYVARPFTGTQFDTETATLGIGVAPMSVLEVPVSCLHEHHRNGSEVSLLLKLNPIFSGGKAECLDSTKITLFFFWCCYLLVARPSSNSGSLIWYGVFRCSITITLNAK